MRALNSIETETVSGGMYVTSGIGPVPEPFTFTLLGNSELHTGWMAWLEAAVPNDSSPLTQPTDVMLRTFAGGELSVGTSFESADAL